MEKRFNSLPIKHQLGWAKSTALLFDTTKRLALSELKRINPLCMMYGDNEEHSRYISDQEKDKCSSLLCNKFGTPDFLESK